MLTPEFIAELQAADTATGELATRLDAIAIAQRKLDLDVASRAHLAAFWAEVEWLAADAHDTARDAASALKELTA